MSARRSDRRCNEPLQNGRCTARRFLYQCPYPPDLIPYFVDDMLALRESMNLYFLSDLTIRMDASTTYREHVLIIPASSTSRCNTICYKSSSVKGGVYDVRETGEGVRDGYPPALITSWRRNRPPRNTRPVPSNAKEVGSGVTLAVHG